MSEELLINVTPQETRVALVDNGVLQEVHIERTRSRGIVGNIYNGKVVRILPGMQAAFVEAGLERTAFLHAADVVVPEEHAEGAEKVDRDTSTTSSSDSPPEIRGLLHDAQDVVVQVVKDPIGGKGARLTTQITIPSRHLVFLPSSTHIGVSQRLQDNEERDRLRDLLRECLASEPGPGGFIIRTAAEGASAEELISDVRFLRRIWSKIEERIKEAGPSSLIHEDLPLAIRTMRDLVNDNIEKVRIDSRETYDKVRKFADELIPELSSHIEYYPGERPLFDLFSVEDEVQRALRKDVPLKSGGYLIVDQTEAMTTVDVNTGAFVGRRNLEETLFKTNLEAAQAIARQLRLRNLGGIVIIDFIDMTDPEHRRQVMRALEKAMSRDRVKSYITEMSSLGLVEVTRKRTRDSLERTLTESCSVCEARGVLKTAETVCYEIFREILRLARQYDANEILVLASQVVIDMLLDEESTSLADLQEFMGKPIRLQVETSYHQELYDIVPV